MNSVQFEYFTTWRQPDWELILAMAILILFGIKKFRFIRVRGII
jgi:hypothetical protein